MDIKKAIEILKLTVKHSRADNTPQVRDAINLGIEALKRIADYRAYPDEPAGEPLPGETQGD